MTDDIPGIVRSITVGRYGNTSIKFFDEMEWCFTFDNCRTWEMADAIASHEPLWKEAEMMWPYLKRCLEVGITQIDGPQFKIPVTDLADVVAA